jgi:hypothetical protein
MTRAGRVLVLSVVMGTRDEDSLHASLFYNQSPDATGCNKNKYDRGKR